VRYFLKPEDQINGKIYWVVGGEYADSNFTKLREGKQLDVFGPFEKWEALGFWRGMTSKSVDDAMVRYDIRKNYDQTSGDGAGTKLSGSRKSVHLQPTAVKSVCISATPDTVFQFVQNARTWPRWAVHNVKSISEGSGGYWKMETPRGTGRLKLDGDPTTGVTDHLFEDANGNSWNVPGRITAAGGGTMFMIVLTKPAAMSMADFTKGMSQLDDEMSKLKAILEE